MDKNTCNAINVWFITSAYGHIRYVGFFAFTEYFGLPEIVEECDKGLIKCEDQIFSDFAV